MNLRYVLMLMALLVASWLAFFSDKTPANGFAEAVTPTNPKQQKHTTQVTLDSTRLINVTNKQQRKTSQSIDQLLPRAGLIGWEHKSKEAIIFGAQSWIPPSPIVKMVRPVPLPPPVAPLLPFQYLGKKMEDGVYEVYLTKGDKTFSVQDQSVIEGTYRVDSIKPPILTMTYLPLKQIQTIPIGNAE